MREWILARRSSLTALRRRYLGRFLDFDRGDSWQCCTGISRRNNGGSFDARLLRGFWGPPVFGIVLDAQVGTAPNDWGIAFMHLSVVMLLRLAALRLLRPQSLAGDKESA